MPQWCVQRNRGAEESFRNPLIAQRTPFHLLEKAERH